MFLPVVRSTFIFMLIAVVCTPAVWAEPKNMILLIGDGMGFEHVKAGGMYAYGSAGALSFEAFPYQGQVTTYSANSSITDSAAAGTAIATGQKVNNDVISVKKPGNGSELYTLLEHFRDSNKSTGLVTVTPMTHATPAAFGAHELSRDNISQIAQDYLNQTRPNVLLGAGGNGLTTSAASSAGYTVVTSRSALMGLNTESVSRVSGQFGANFPYEYNGYSATYPHLSEMTTIALSILDNDPDGFFLMVEGGLIDWGAHVNVTGYTVFEVVEFNNSVEAVLAWAQGRTDTLIVVTADHETGGLTVLQNNGQGSLPTVSWSTTGHTADNVPVYAIGENSQLFTRGP
jgi:alkaline phosphatase